MCGGGRRTNGTLAHVCGSFLFVWAWPLCHINIRMYAAAICAQGAFAYLRIYVFAYLRIHVSSILRISFVMDGDWDAAGEYTPSQQQVAQRMWDWNVPRGGENAVFVWLKMLAESRWFATGIYFPAVWNGVMGVCLCVSTAASTRVSKANSEVDENMKRRGGIETPEWFAFDVFFYANLVFGNLHGFRDPEGRVLGTLAYVLEQLSATAGIRDWTRDVFVRHGEWMYAGLRRILDRLRIRVHAEVVSGLSYRALMSLDVFIAIHAPSMGYEPQGMALWVAAGEPGVYPTQDQWWHQDVYRPWGQSPHGNLMDYRLDLGITVQVPGVLAVFPLAATGPASASRRMSIVLGHIPDVAIATRMASVLPPVQPQVSPRIGAITDGTQEEEPSRL